MEGVRFRHTAQFVRWRPDRDPRSCTYRAARRAGQLTTWPTSWAAAGRAGLPMAERWDTGRRELVRRAAIGAAITGGSVTALGALSSVSAAAYFARRVLTPDRQRPDDTEIREVSEHSVTLGLTAETVVPGRYGLWLDDGSRPLPGGGRPPRRRGRRGWSVGSCSVSTTATSPLGSRAGTSTTSALAPSSRSACPLATSRCSPSSGPMPAWVIEAEPRTTRWAILVHGRGARREERSACGETVAGQRDQRPDPLLPQRRRRAERAPTAATTWGCRSGATSRTRPCMPCSREPAS